MGLRLTLGQSSTNNHKRPTPPMESGQSSTNNHKRPTPPMESGQSSTPVNATSIQLVKNCNPETILKEKKQHEPQHQPKPTKKRYISKQSMAFMHC
ncbi:hypothetical protein PHYPSEUDO_005429 [Phytophthora pseudosyringae]|uniref:Uncharacterized protein n=1 Tax=Phytophthora pseudosyringae TaxID=221518 RepID=A0A8T1VP15_9STRA|nr:hypothetical protein PHYPSEUDO_005429 [Phytophthora pseudosyringae]